MHTTLKDNDFLSKVVPCHSGLFHFTSYGLCLSRVIVLIIRSCFTERLPVQSAAAAGILTGSIVFFQNNGKMSKMI